MARQCSVIWVASPPGSGKTTLAASYLDARKLPCLWYQVDEGEADIATFFYYMGIAVEKAATSRRGISGKQKPLPLLTPEYLQNITLFTKRYFEALYSKLKSPFFIVFDNYQDVSASSGFHGMIIHGVDVIPEGINFLVLSRNEPPPQFSRLRANNKISLLGWNDIRFTLDESRELIRRKISFPSPTLRGEGKGNMGNKKRQGIPEEIFVRLHTKTEGWAAGLILMMEGAKTKNFSLFDDKDGNYQLLNKLTSGEIFDYFTSEIFEKTDKEVQDFLSKTAFLPKVTAPIAEKLTGVSTAGQILSDLHRNNYFTAMYLRAEPVYQYHPLFREFLLSKARNLFNPDELCRTQRNAAVFLEESGQIEDAAALFCNVKDWDGFVRLILNHAEYLVAQGRNKTLEEWLFNIPEEVRECTPWLLYWLGVCRLPFDHAEGGRLFERAHELFRIQGDRTGILLSWANVAGAFLLAMENVTTLDKWMVLSEDIFQKDSIFPSLEVEIRVVSTRFFLVFYRQPQHPEIDTLAERIVSFLHGCRDVGFRQQVEWFLSVYYLWTGNFVKAGMMVKIIQEDINSGESSPLGQLVGKTTEAMYAWLTGSVTACLRMVSDGLKLARETGIHIWDRHLLSFGTCASLSSGDTRTAIKLLQKIEPGLAGARKIDIGFYNFLITWEALISGNLPAALEHGKISLKAVMEVGIHFPVAVTRVMMAQIYFELGACTEAATELYLAYQIGRLMKSKQVGFMCLLTDAQFALDKKAIESGKVALRPHPSPKISTEAERRGLDTLRKAMELGREQGYVNMFGWRPDIMTRLCVKAIEAGIEVEYVQNLVRKRSLIPDAPPLECENWPWPLKIFTLGRFALLKDGKPLKFSRKAQQKPLLMLKAIIVLGGGDVKEEQVNDLLWPDADGDLAHMSFKATLHRLRQLTGNERIIQFQEGRIIIDPRYCWVDVWAFERMCEKVDGLSESFGETEKGRGWEILTPETRNPKPETQNLEIVQLSEKAISMYQQGFLPGDQGQPWTISMRERLKSKFARLVDRMGHYYRQTGQWERAIGCYQKALEMDNLQETFYRCLMLCQQKLGQRAEALAIYARCRAILSTVLGIEPSPETEAIYKALCAENKVNKPRNC